MSAIAPPGVGGVGGVGVQAPVYVHQATQRRIQQLGHPRALFGQKARVLLVAAPILQVNLLVRDVHVAAQDELPLLLQLGQMREELGQEAEFGLLPVLSRRAAGEVAADQRQLGARRVKAQFQVATLGVEFARAVTDDDVARFVPRVHSHARVTLLLRKLVVLYDLQNKKMIGYQNTLNFLYADETPDDPATRQCIDKWKERVDKVSGQKIGCISEPLTRSYGEESTLGNMVADGMLHAFPDYELALVNSGGLREDILGPNVTTGDLISAFPFPNTVVKLELKGVFLREIFEHAADQTNGVLQVSAGLVLQYNDSLPLGNRVVSCTLNGKALEDERIYKVLANNFLVKGGDGFLSFSKASANIETHLGVVQTMISYLKTFPVYPPKLEGRVVKLNK